MVDTKRKSGSSVGPYGLKQVGIKDSADRLSNFGKGFSRHLSMLNMEQISPREMISSNVTIGHKGTTSHILKQTRQSMKKALKNLKKDLSIKQLNAMQNSIEDSLDKKQRRLPV